MTTCEQIEVWISAYQDGELDPPRQRRVEGHLAGCDRCRELLAEWTALERTLHAELVRLDAPETLHTRVMRQIPEPAVAGRKGGSSPTRWFSFSLVPIGALAAMLAWTTRTVDPIAPAGTGTPPTTISTAVEPSEDPAASPGSLTMANKPETQNNVSSSSPATGIRVTSPVKGPKPVQPSIRRRGTNQGTRRGYDPARGMRQRRWRPRRYPLVDRPTRREYRIVRNDQPQLPVAPPTEPRERRLADVPKFTVVDYILPQVPVTTPAEGQETTEFVMRPAGTRELAQAGYEF